MNAGKKYCFMIYFNLLGKYGGFGNQLFQYAVAYVHAKRFQTEVCTTPHKSYYHDGYKMMSHFIADYIDIPLKISTNHTPKREFNESNFLYNDSIELIEDETNLNGYFQTEKYFLTRKSEIISLYKNHYFKDKVSSYFYDRGLDPKEVTGIHVRRNDFLNKQEYHPVQSVEYFEISINECKTKNYLIVSDDKVWCKEVFGNRSNFTIVETDHDVIDFYILSECRNQIISNSSFGWWAAYLNTNDDKIVVSPKNWYGIYGNQHLSDLIPNNWKRI